MRLHLETSLWHAGTASAATAPGGDSRTRLGLLVVAFMGDVNLPSALARRGMR